MSTAGGEDGRAAAARRDRAVLRRALLAGAAVWALVSGALALLGAGSLGAAAAVLFGLGGGFVAAALMTALWLALAGIADLLADRPPGRRRVAVMVAAFATALLAPALVAGLAG